MAVAGPDVIAVAADTVVLATWNAGKLRELARILAAAEIGELVLVGRGQDQP